MMPNARGELNRSVREQKAKCKHYMNTLEGIELMMGKCLGECLFESVVKILCSFLLEVDIAVLSVYSLHLAVCANLDTLCLACLYKSLKIVNLVFPNFIFAQHLSPLCYENLTFNCNFSCAANVHITTA